MTPLSSAPDEDRLLFSHELIRQTLLAALSQPRRRRLHLLVADTLERRHADGLDTVASEIAHHLIQAGSAAEPRRLLRFSTLAGRQAMRTAGFEDALRHFEQALALIDVAEPAQRADLFADRASARRSLGNYDDALPDWDEALQRFESLDDSEAAARVCLQTSIDLWWLMRDREALTLAERGLAALGGRETPQRAKMLGWTGVSHGFVSPYEPGAALIDESLALAERLGEKRLVGYGLLSRALHAFAFGLQHKVLEAGQEGARLLRAEGDLWEMVSLLTFMECSATELGRMRLAAELGQEMEAQATRLGHVIALFAYHEVAVSARHWAASPDLAGLEASARRHLEGAGAMGFRHHSGALLARAAFLRGDWEDALWKAEEGVRHAPQHHHTTGREWAVYLLILAHLDRPGRVVAALDGPVEDFFPRPGQRNGYGSWYLVPAAIEALAVIGERERAAGLYPLLREYMESTGAILLCFAPSLLERAAAIGAAAGRQWDLAEEHFSTALRQAEELPVVSEAAETRRWYAQMLLDRDGPGDRDRARSLVEEAIPIYRRIGMTCHQELARELLRR